MKKETKKDIKIMALQFFGACLIFWLVSDISHPYLIKDFQISEQVSIGINLFLSFVGMFVLFSFIFVSARNIFKYLNKYNGNARRKNKKNRNKAK